MTPSRSDLTKEQKLIEEIKKWAGDKHIGDDCAVLPGGQLVTADALVEGTHFITDQIGYENLGWKAAAVNLSDIAAMSGRPRHLVVSLTLPESINKSAIRKLMMSLIDCAKTYRANVVGGDLTAGPVLVINVTVIGDVHESGCLTRSGAKPGDVVVATGDFGASRAGLNLLGRKAEQRKFPYAWQRHVKPLPRLCESWALVRQAGNRASLMDASDGLADALIQIARASQVGIEVNGADIPIHAETIELAKISGCDPLDWALYGGEDYELVGTLPENIWASWKNKENNPFREIGRVNSTSGVVLKSNGQSIPLELKKTFQHWADF